MLRFVFRRILSFIPLIFILSLFTFLLLNEVGDPLSYYIQNSASAEDLERISKSLGLDRPRIVRYFDWLTDILTGNWGNSLVTGRPVSTLLMDRLPATVLLMGTAFLITLLISIPLGIIAAIKRNTPIDYVISTFVLFAFSIPTFWTGIMAILIFSLETRRLGLPYLPSGGMYNLVQGPTPQSIATHLILPVTILTLFSMARYVKFMRSAMIDILNNDYIRTARAKGLKERSVIFSHAFRNGILPVAALIVVDIPRLIGGALITEQVFAWPGMGRLMVEHSMRADFPVLMGILVLTVGFVAVMSLIGDIVLVFLDPRIRIQ